jgi:hypothetical protein
MKDSKKNIQSKEQQITDINDYIGEYFTDNNTLEETLNLCMGLYNDISLVINNMV